MANYLLYTEQEAASRLGISSVTLRRERQEGQIGYLKIRSRVRYTEVHLLNYLARNERCPKLNRCSELGSTSLENAPTLLHGARVGMIPKRDKQSEHLLAQMFFKKQK